MSAWSTLEFTVTRMPERISIMKALHDFADSRTAEYKISRVGFSAIDDFSFMISISEENESAMKYFTALMDFFLEKKIVIDGLLSVRILT